jgi:ribosomal-protein-alanine N-acetyltransferase
VLPILETPRLLLRPAQADDLDAIWQLLVEPEVRRYLCDDVVLARGQVSGLLAKALVQASAGLGLWTLRAAGGFVGCVGLRPVSDAAMAADPAVVGEVEPLVALEPQRWGRGYASEALAALLAYGFDALRLPRVVALVDLPNTASHRLLLRLGFRPQRPVPGPRHPLWSYLLEPAVIPSTPSNAA